MVDIFPVPTEAGLDFLERHDTFVKNGTFTSHVPPVVATLCFEQELLTYAAELEEQEWLRYQVDLRAPVPPSKTNTVSEWIATNIELMRQDILLQEVELGVSFEPQAEVQARIWPRYNETDHAHTDGPTGLPLIFHLGVAGPSTLYYMGDYAEQLPRNHGHDLDAQKTTPIRYGSGTIVRGDFSTLHEAPGKDGWGVPRVALRMKSIAKMHL